MSVIIKGSFHNPFFKVTLYTKFVEIFIPLGHPGYKMIMCQIIAHSFPFQRYQPFCLIFNIRAFLKNSLSPIAALCHICSSKLSYCRCALKSLSALSGHDQNLHPFYDEYLGNHFKAQAQWDYTQF